ncbi:MAG TPA: flagellar basal body L-ring protein FlgH [Limnobacter sp.]|uniref:flagellar basal body L-ring protein FlgH n=1 Tax=Limnobacter sp. TaxID=2003368 RepID=UPI002ED972B8
MHALFRKPWHCSPWLLLLLTACAGFEPRVDFPPEAGVSTMGAQGRADPKDWQAEKARQQALFEDMAGMRIPPKSGAIYSSSGYRSLYEDNKAKYVGDVVVIDVQESTSALQAKTTSAKRSDSASVNVPSIGGFNGLNGSASGSKDFSGDGRTSATNALNGTITTRVIEVLPNGYLRVAGEKQLGVNRQVETLRFYGVVDPFTLKPGSRVVSTNVADARIEVVGSGTIDDVQMMGFLSRVFLSVLPF